MLFLNSKTLKWPLSDKMVYDKPMTTISIREAMHWGQLDSSIGPNRASKGGDRSSERHPPSNQRKASGKTLR